MSTLLIVWVMWQVLKASRKRATGDAADGEDEDKPVKKTRVPRKAAVKSAPAPKAPAADGEAESEAPEAAAEGAGAKKPKAKAKPPVDLEALAKEFADKEPCSSRYKQSSLG